MDSRKQIVYQYGLGMGLGMVVVYGVLYALGYYNLGDQSSSNWPLMTFNITLSIVVPLLAMLKVRSLDGGFIKLGRAFSTGWSVILVATIVGALWIFLYCYVLEPGYQEEIIRGAYDQWQAQGMSDEQMEQAETFTRWMTSAVGMSVITIISSAIMGALISLVLGLIVQKRNPNEIY